MRHLISILIILFTFSCGKATVEQVPVVVIPEPAVIVEPDEPDEPVGIIMTTGATIKIVDKDSGVYSFEISRIPNAKLAGIEPDSIEYCYNVHEYTSAISLKTKDYYKNFGSFDCIEWMSFDNIQKNVGTVSGYHYIINYAARSVDNPANTQIYNRVHVRHNLSFMIDVHSCTDLLDRDWSNGWILNNNVDCTSEYIPDSLLARMYSDMYIYGNGYTIKNTNINNADLVHAGFFGHQVKGYISNLVFDNLNVYSDFDSPVVNVGAVVPAMFLTTIEYVSASVVVEGFKTASGLSSVAADNKIHDVHITGIVTSGLESSGLIGSSFMNILFENSFTGDIIAPSASGLVTESDTDLVIDCFFNGNTGSGVASASLIGWFKNSYMSTSYSNDTNAPIIGNNTNSFIESSVYHNHAGDLTNGTYLPFMNNSFYFNGFDFSGVWTMVNGLPINY